jgi:hypothetical protein
MLIQFAPPVHRLRRPRDNSLDRDEGAPLSKSGARFEVANNRLISLQEGGRLADGVVLRAAG